MDRGFELVVILVFPGFRLELFARIGPEIAVVEIEQQPHALRFNTFGQRKRRSEIVGAAAVRRARAVFWVDPQAQTHVVDAVLTQNSQRVLRFVVRIVERRALALQLRQRGDIRALNKIGRERERLRRYLRRTGGESGKTAGQRGGKQCGFTQFHQIILWYCRRSGRRRSISVRPGREWRRVRQSALRLRRRWCSSRPSSAPPGYRAR